MPVILIVTEIIYKTNKQKNKKDQNICILVFDLSDFQLTQICGASGSRQLCYSVSLVLLTQGQISFAPVTFNQLQNLPIDLYYPPPSYRTVGGCPCVGSVGM